MSSLDPPPATPEPPPRPSAADQEPPPPPSDADNGSPVATSPPPSTPAPAPPDAAAPAPAAPAAATPSHHHTRLIISIALLVVTMVATPLFIVAIWVNTQIKDTDRYVSTVAPLADDPAVQQYVAAQLADAFEQNVDVKTILSQQLPSALQPLSGTITNAVYGFVESAAERFTASPAFKTLWEQANRTAHTTISKVLTGDSKALDLSNGELTIDLGNVLRQFQQRLVDQGFDVASKVDLSNVHKEIVLADSERVAKIENARDTIGLLYKLVWLLGILALAAAIASVAVAPKRGSALKRLGVGLALIVVVVAIGVATTRRAFVSAAGQTVPTAVVGSFFDALVGSIRFAFRLVFVLGLVMALLVAIVSLPGYATRWARATQIGVAVIGVGALVALKEPTWGLVLFIIVLVVVAEIALEVARRRGLVQAASTAPLSTA
jgi:hypothetical protein